ncbi:MAG: DUF5667 domain-containing protein [bacterium]
MGENLLINKLKKLNQIKPRQNWVLSVKNRILFEAEDIQIKPQTHNIFSVLFQPKTALIGTMSLALISGLFSFASNSLPGDFLYSLKRVAEKGQVALVPENNLAEAQMEFTNKRLEELTKIAQDNKVKKLAPAIQEYQASVAEIVKNLARVKTSTSSTEAIKGIAEQVQKFEKNKEILKNTYGIAGLEAEDAVNPTKLVVEWLIRDLEGRTMDQDRTQIFNVIKADYNAGDYVLSLEKILKLSEMGYPQETY